MQKALIEEEMKRQEEEMKTIEEEERKLRQHLEDQQNLLKSKTEEKASLENQIFGFNDKDENGNDLGASEMKLRLMIQEMLLLQTMGAQKEQAAAKLQQLEKEEKEEGEIEVKESQMVRVDVD